GALQGLGLRGQTTLLEGSEIVEQQTRRRVGEACRELGRREARPDRYARAGEDRPGVQARIHLHQRYAALAVPGQNRALDGRRSTPAWQQGGVQVDAAQA